MQIYQEIKSQTFNTMNLNKPTGFTAVHFRELYSMERQVASTLPLLSGSVMNTRLRKLLWERCLRARDRRDQLAPLADGCHEAQSDVVCVVTRGILSGGHKILAVVGNPQVRDFMMVGHCLRVENHELSAYCRAALLAERGGYATEALLLLGMQSDLKIARLRLQSLEDELFPTETHDFSPNELKKAKWDVQSGATAMELEPVHAA